MVNHVAPVISLVSVVAAVFVAVAVAMPADAVAVGAAAVVYVVHVELEPNYLNLIFHRLFHLTINLQDFVVCLYDDLFLDYEQFH